MVRREPVLDNQESLQICFLEHRTQSDNQATDLSLCPCLTSLSFLEHQVEQTIDLHMSKLSRGRRISFILPTRSSSRRCIIPVLACAKRGSGGKQHHFMVEDRVLQFSRSIMISFSLPACSARNRNTSDYTPLVES